MARKSLINKDVEDFLPFPDTILSLSGGGVKGIMQLAVLEKIEEITGKPICELFPIITGTSVGGLIAALLTIPKEPGSTEPLFSVKEAFKLFESKTDVIFEQHWYHIGKIGQIFSHKYSQKPLKALLDEYLGDMELVNLLSRVLITTFDASGKDPINIFDSYNSPSVKVKDVVLATTAAPSYFKSVKIEDKDGVHILVDGGVGYNRPAAEALKHLKEGLSRNQQGEMLDNLTLVALNFESPHEKKEILPPHLDGILPQLGNGLVSDIMKAAQKAATKEVERDLPGEGQFTNLLLPVPKGSTKLDDATPKNMAKLKKAAEQYIEDNKELIEKLCITLVKNANVREESAKLHEQQISVEDSSISSELVTSDAITKRQDNDDDSNVVSKPIISGEFETKLAINLSEKQVATLQDGLRKLTPKEYDVLQTFLKGLNDAQLVALSKHLPLIADGNFTNVNISEFSNFQNKFLKFFSSMFESADDINIVEDALLTCAQEYQNEVGCDGRGSELSHCADVVY